MDVKDICNEYFRDVFNFALSLARNRDVAGDIAQETFIKALRRLDRYDGVQDVRAWLFAIAKNAYMDRCRRDKRLEPLSVTVSDVSDGGADIPHKLADEETAFAIHKYLHDMPEPYKEVFTLRVFGELPFERIGSLFGKSAGWARVVYYRAKKRIADHMEELNDG